MPLVVMPAEEAWKVVRRNKHSRWPDPEKSPNRLVPVASPRSYKTFSIDRTESVFTIGSCFARNIEEVLAQLGFRVPALDIAAKEEDRATGRPNGMLNKFVTQSIEFELSWALGAIEYDPESVLLPIGDEGYIDPFLKPGLPPVSLERGVERRLEVLANTKRVTECATVIITLGLVESWYDKELRCYLNLTPPFSVIRNNPGIFEYRISDYQDIVSSIENTIMLLRTRSIPDTKILISVSPVPLNTTFSGSDILVANTYSKSVLRAAAEYVCRRHNNVDYFPSFEAVMLSPRESAWQHDLAHVDPRFVQRIVQRMTREYCGIDDYGDSTSV